MLIVKADTEGVAEAIIEFEKKYNFIFPDSYKNFLLKYNGGDTPETDFRLGKISSDLRGLYGLAKAKEYYNYSYFEGMPFGIPEYVKHSVIPIGDNIFGDKICIGIGGNKQDKVYFLYHDRPTRYIKLADSFEEFVNACKSEYEQPPKSIEERKQTMIDAGRGDEIPKFIGFWQESLANYEPVVQEEVIL